MMNHSLPDMRRTFIDVGHILLHNTAILLGVFLRKPGTFGNRYFNIGQFCLGLLSFPAILVIHSVFWGLSHTSVSPMSPFTLWTMRGFAIGYVGLSILHLYRQYEQNVKGEPCHARYSGSGYLEWLKTTPPVKVGSVILRFDDGSISLLEPGMIFALAWLCLPYGITRFTILWCAAALFIQHGLVWYGYRKMMREMDTNTISEQWERIPTRWEHMTEQEDKDDDNTPPDAREGVRSGYM